jgi:hypothetical protein
MNTIKGFKVKVTTDFGEGEVFENIINVKGNSENFSTDRFLEYNALDSGTSTVIIIESNINLYECDVRSITPGSLSDLCNLRQDWKLNGYMYSSLYSKPDIINLLNAGNILVAVKPFGEIDMAKANNLD